MNTGHDKPVWSLNRPLGRRGFIAGALTTGLVASAMPARTIETTMSGNSHYQSDAFKLSNAQGSNVKGAIDKMRQTPPLRAGLRRVFNPSQGERESWYINDHCFVQDDSGTWHLFGITGKEPANPANEKFFLHAIAKDLCGPWVKQKPVMHVDPDEGETVVWAPYVLKHDGRYWMFYCGGGESHMKYRINLATSSDLLSWTRSPANPMVLDGYDARDPMVLRVGSQWILYYCATESPSGGNHVVIAATSSDLVHWTGREIVFRSPYTGTFGGPTESPYVVAKGNKYYLFLCTNNPYNNTEVYVSDSPFHWNSEDVVLRFDAHAAEVVNVGRGKWFLSAAGWGQGGLYLAELMWNDSFEE